MFNKKTEGMEGKYGSLGISDGCAPGAPQQADAGRFFVHIHLPKTGGSTFNTILEDNFKESYEPFAGRFVHLYPMLNEDQITHFVKKHSGIKAASSHLFRAILPYQSAERAVIGIAFIREPVDKFFSYYFHMRHRHGVDCKEKELELHAYIDHRTKAGYKGYLHQLVGVENELAFEYVQELVEHGNLFLFNTYDMPGAISELHRHFPEDFADKPFEKENISVKDQEVTEEMKERVRNWISEYDFRLIEIANKAVAG